MQTLQQIYDGTIEIPCLFNSSLSYQDERFFNKTIMFYIYAQCVNCQFENNYI